MNGLTIPKQGFTQATSLKTNIAYDGMLGLGFSSKAVSKSSNLIDNALANKKIPTKTFSIWLGASRGELYLGGANSARYTGNQF